MSSRVRDLWSTLALGATLVAGLAGCDQTLDPEDEARATAPRVTLHFNRPSANEEVGINTPVDDILVQMIDRARVSVDFAVMGFSKTTIVDALVRAWGRGVQLRFVGDARHAWGTVVGYHEMDRLNIPMAIGNQSHIMHNKFFIVDDRFVLTGTGNITSTGFDRNDNNWAFIDSPQVASDFKDEFEQMMRGRFGFGKDKIDNGNAYTVGDTRVETCFSPQEDCMGRILQGIDEATESIEFFIFAFTKDQVGSGLIAKHNEFERYNDCCSPGRRPRLSAEELAQCDAEITCETPYRRKFVRGVIDRSQLHSNGPYHEIYRLLANGLDLRIDGNDNSRTPGDYQAGGGRQHSKTMIVDGRTEDAVILTGSFNWSSSATVSNDETLLVLKGARMGARYVEYFDVLWGLGKDYGGNYVGDEDGTAAGDVIINEVMWDGYNGDCLHRSIAGLTVPCDDAEANTREQVNNDEFVELLNTTDRVIDLSLWTLTTQNDFVVGFYPGTVIGPYERFLVLGHNTQPYDDLYPHTRGGAYDKADFVMNMANDQRFLRLNLRNADFEIGLIDRRGVRVDRAGDGGPPFFGGRQSDPDGVVRNYSMVRSHIPCRDDGSDRPCVQVGDGADPRSWGIALGEGGGENVRPAYRDIIIATPGTPNPGTALPDEDPTFRSETGVRDSAEEQVP